MEKLVFCFLVCFSATAMAAYKLPEHLTEKVKNQTELEMKASIFYQTYGHYFENSDQALHGIANFFFKQSLEEKEHADKLMTYLNMRDASVGYFGSVGGFCSELNDRNLCDAVVYQNATVDEELTARALLAIEDALGLEQKVFNKLEDIIKDEPNKKSDAQLSHFIEHEYLDEQVESIKKLLDFQTQIKNIENNVGLLLFDHWLLDSKKTEL